MTNDRKQMRSLRSWLIDDELLDLGDLAREPQALAPDTLDEDWPDPEFFVLPPAAAPPRRVRTLTQGLERSRQLHRLLARVRE
jgi:hypothetical protein